ncbi:MAG: hypothetical protein ACR2IG_17720 [Roseomonas sp.]
MGTVRVKLEAGKPVTGRIDASRVDATTEADLRRYAAEDDAAAAQDARPKGRVKCQPAMSRDQPIVR